MKARIAEEIAVSVSDTIFTPTEAEEANGQGGAASLAVSIPKAPYIDIDIDHPNQT